MGKILAVPVRERVPRVINIYLPLWSRARKEGRPRPSLAVLVRLLAGRVRAREMRAKIGSSLKTTSAQPLSCPFLSDRPLKGRQWEGVQLAMRGDESGALNEKRVRSREKLLLPDGRTRTDDH